ncbi:hypothetical protein [Streptomyces celluloflavus]|uniref:hypothetical protein n=1 Tax=Streptomyces celluloflavus TaxID=58344 RepID=UPI0036A41BC6
MSTGTSITITGAIETAASFTRASAALRMTSRQAVEVSARRIKEDARRRISGHPHLPHYPHSITYDLRSSAAGPWAEIGPDKSRTQGPLGNVIEFGTRNNAPIPHIGPAFEAGVPDFVHGMTRAVTDATR